MSSQGAASATALAQLCESLLAQEHGTQQYASTATSPYGDLNGSGKSPAPSTSVDGSSAMFGSAAPALGAIDPALCQHNSAMGSTSSSSSNAHASTSATEPEQRCSQCKQFRPLSDFPTRLTTLKPFQVCKSHSWYWTEEKKELHWAPDELVTLDTICREVGEVRSGRVTVGSWLVRGAGLDVKAIVKRISDVGHWQANNIPIRKSRAKSGEAPPQPVHYQLQPPTHDDGEPTWRLIITYHETENKYVVTFKRDEGRQSGPWTRKDRNKNADVAAPSTSGDGQTKSKRGKAATKLKGKGAANHTSTTAPNGLEFAHSSGLSAQAIELHRQLSNGSSSAAARSPSIGSPPVQQLTIEEQAEMDRRRFEDEQGLIQVNDPPLPRLPSPTDPKSTAPVPLDQTPSDVVHTKKRRRVEPSLQNGDSTTSASAHLGDLLVNGTPDIAVTAPRANYVDFSVQPRPQAARPPTVNGRSHAVYHQRPQTQPLTLTELLASPLFEPPVIPLHQRTMVMNAREYYAAGASRRATSMGLAENVGQSPKSSSTATHDADLLVSGNNRGRTEVEQDAAPSDGEEITSDDDDDEDESESSDEEGGGDWLTGFVKGQLTGLGGQASQEEVDELEEE